MSCAVQDSKEAATQSESPLPVPARKAVAFRQLLGSCSVATLCFLPIWQHVLSYAEGESTRYFEKAAPSPALLGALIFDVLTVAVSLWLCFRGRASGNNVVRYAATGIILFCMFSGFWQLRSLVLHVPFEKRIPASPMFIVNVWPWIAAAALVLLLRTRLFDGLETVFLILSPLPAILILNAGLHYVTAQKQITAGNSAGMLPAKPSAARVVWVIFDEMDNRLLNEARPPRLQMPEFDRLVQQSLVGTKVSSPAWETLTAIPSLLLGQAVDDVNQNTSSLSVHTVQEHRWKDFASAPTVFSNLRKQGFNTGVSGWYHPYCRVIGDQVSACDWGIGWFPYTFVPEYLRTASFFKQAAYLFHWQANGLPFSRPSIAWTPTAPGELQHMRNTDQQTLDLVLSGGLAMLRNQDFNFVYIHLPIPHLPGLAPNGNGDTRTNYFDNLKLVDAAIGKIRRQLEQSGDWDRSAVLITSDHPFRPEMWSETAMWDQEMAHASNNRWQPYIPFVLKMPNQQHTMYDDHKFNSVITGELLSDIMKGQLRSAQDVANWVDAQPGH